MFKDLKEIMSKELKESMATINQQIQKLNRVRNPKKE